MAQSNDFLKAESEVKPNIPGMWMQGRKRKDRYEMFKVVYRYLR